MGLSLPHLIIVALVVLVLFGRGRISEMMGDFGKGIKSFKHGMNEEMDPPVTPPTTMPQPVQIAAQSSSQVEPQPPIPSAPAPHAPIPHAAPRPGGTPAGAVDANGVAP